MKASPLLPILLLLASCSSEKQAPPPAQALTEVGYITLKAEKTPSTATLNGRVVSTMTSEIRPQVSGIITSRLFKEGDWVEKGVALYQIDPAPYQAALEQAQATLANAEAAVSAAKLKTERYGDLVEIQGVSTQDADDAKVTYLQAVASVAINKAAVKTAKINLDYTTIRAPISGRIGKSSITPGTLVTASQTTALATIRVLDPVFVDLTESSTHLLAIKKALSKNGIVQGDKSISLILSDGEPYDQKGILKFSEISVDEATDMVTLRAEFRNQAQTLLPGMFVRAKLDVLVDENAILAPQQGIMRSPNGSATAVILNDQNVAVERNVVTERVVGDKWIVTSGLVDGDKIVVEGLNKLKIGAKVSPIEITNLGTAKANGGTGVTAQSSTKVNTEKNS